MKILRLLPLFAASIAFVNGCTVSSSSGTAAGSGASSPREPLHSATIDVKSMRASFSAQSGDSTMKVYAAVFSRSPDGTDILPVVLDEGDYFTAKIGTADPVVLTREPNEDATSVHYTATLPSSLAAEDVTIALVRPAGKTGAPSSVLHVPEAFSITSTPPVSLKKGDPLEIDLSRGIDATDDGALLEATGSCITDNEKNTWVIDAGTDHRVIFDTGLLQLASGSQGCDVSFYVSFVREGTIDPSFAGGVSGVFDAEGLQKRGTDTSIVVSQAS